MNRRQTSIHFRTVRSLAAFALLATGGQLFAGPLDPPAGPMAPSYKTLTEVEPRIAINDANTPGDAESLFKITQPGSYYLTSNVTGAVGKHGIEIVASGVTLDLMGFDLTGIPAMGDFDGVSVTVENHTNIAVVNGSVRDWGGDGVLLASSNGRVEGVLAEGNAGNGIFAGSGAVVVNCSATANIGTGIFTGEGCAVSNCSALGNFGHGIRTSTSCTVSNCAVAFHGGNGIFALDGCTVSNCSVDLSGGTGIFVNAGSTVADCTIARSFLNGIRCGFNCVIRGNTCYLNGLNAGDGAGIFVHGTGNHIESNNCSRADRGIHAGVPNNFIIRNTCVGNTTNNWDVAAGNVCLVVQGVTGAAIVGNTGGVSPGSTDPNANFTY